MEIDLVVGLGNPGDEYAATRHNAGFRVVDALARRLAVRGWERRGNALTVRSTREPAVWLAKPQTYMNRSGSAVLLLSAELSIPPEAILVVADDVDLPLGRLRLRRSGGPGTHNGLRDIVEAVGTGFPRLRLGVRGERPFDDLAEYVLTRFEPGEEETAREAVERAAEAVEVVLSDGFLVAMNRFNRGVPSPPEAPLSS
jgi:PTH1 family peptidyl-tRNA hydrolase